MTRHDDESPVDNHSHPGQLAGYGRPSMGAWWMTDRLISVRDIQVLFGLGRTAAYELTHRRGFPDPVVISPRCHRWWATEVTAFAASIRPEGPEPTRPGNASRVSERQVPHMSTPPRRISGKVRVTRARREAS